MRDLAAFAVLGVGLGAMYAAMAVGLVVTFRASGVVNFAYATMAAFPAMAYQQLVKSGRLSLPWVWLPADFKVAKQVSPPVAFVIAVGVGVLLGALVHVLVFRPLRNSSALSRLVASVGLTVLVQAISTYRFGPSMRRPKPILPDANITLLDHKIPRDRPLLALVVCLLIVAVWLILGRSRFGLATRASAESEKGAVLLGLSPDRLAFLNALLASGLGAVTGILLCPIAGASPTSYSFFVVPALAAALAGRLRYFLPTTAVALGLGMFQSMLVRMSTYDWIPNAMRSGFDQGVPFLLIVIFLAVVGKNLPQRGTLADPPQIRAGWARFPARWLVAGGAVAVLVMLTADRTIRFPLIVSMSMMVLALSQVVLTGYLGQISLAQLTFSGTAGFLLAKLTTGWHLGAPLAPLLAIVVPTALGLVISLPALRIRGVQLAMVTLAFAIAAEQLVFRNAWFTGRASVATIQSPKIFGHDLGVLGKHEFPQRPFGVILIVVTIGCLALVANLRRSATGRRFLAVRANERAAASGGIDVARTKLLGSGISAGLASTAGVMIGYSSVSISAVGYETRYSLALLALGYLAGVGHLSGAVIAGLLTSGGLAFTLFEKASGHGSATAQFFLSGLGLLLVTRWMPDGLAGLAARLGHLAARALRPAPLLVTTGGSGVIEVYDPVSGRPI